MESAWLMFEGTIALPFSPARSDQQGPGTHLPPTHTSRAPGTYLHPPHTSRAPGPHLPPTHTSADTPPPCPASLPSTSLPCLTALHLPACPPLTGRWKNMHVAIKIMLVQTHNRGSSGRGVGRHQCRCCSRRCKGPAGTQGGAAGGGAVLQHEPPQRGGHVRLRCADRISHA